MPFNFGFPLIIPSIKEVARKSKIFSLHSARYICGRELVLRRIFLSNKERTKALWGQCSAGRFAWAALRGTSGHFSALTARFSASFFFRAGSVQRACGCEEPLEGRALKPFAGNAPLIVAGSALWRKWLQATCFYFSRADAFEVKAGVGDTSINHCVCTTKSRFDYVLLILQLIKLIFLLSLLVILAFANDIDLKVNDITRRGESDKMFTFGIWTTRIIY